MYPARWHPYFFVENPEIMSASFDQLRPTTINGSIQNAIDFIQVFNTPSIPSRVQIISAPLLAISKKFKQTLSKHTEYSVLNLRLRIKLCFPVTPGS